MIASETAVNGSYTFSQFGYLNLTAALQSTYACLGVPCLSVGELYAGQPACIDATPAPTSSPQPSFTPEPTFESSYSVLSGGDIAAIILVPAAFGIAVAAAYMIGRRAGVHLAVKRLSMPPVVPPMNGESHFPLSAPAVRELEEVTAWTRGSKFVELA